jgi:3-deoxy-D-manno-octulosonic-acid transferase
VVRIRRDWALQWYGLAWWLATPLVMAYLLWRSWRQPEYRQGWAERWALDDGELPESSDRTRQGKLIWIHAVSVGETRAAAPLVRALLQDDPQRRIVFTHMTPTGRQTSVELFGDGVMRRYLPYDLAWAQRRLIARLKPALILIMETELWPNLINEARRAGVPIALVNARLSEKSLRQGLKRRGLLAPALQQLDLVLAQGRDDAQRISQLAPRTLEVLGNLKFDHAIDEDKRALGRAWRAAAKRPAVLMASSREGEEAALLEAVQRHPQASAVQWWWVPRHPQRFDEVWALLASGAAAQGGAAVRRSAGGFDREREQAWLVLGDSMGELAAYLECADVVIMGGSLGAFGSQNLIEPCAQGRAVLLGPSTFNFALASELALKAGAALQLDNAQALVNQAILLAQDQPKREAMRNCGITFTHEHRGATARTLSALKKAGLLT